MVAESQVWSRREKRLARMLPEALRNWHSPFLCLGAMRRGLTQPSTHLRLAAVEKLERGLG